MLLTEYAITPDVFDGDSYDSEEVCAARLETIREVMLNEAIVRDLRDRDWSALFKTTSRSWHRRAIELSKKLASQNRLKPFKSQLEIKPAVDSDWCDEALATHKVNALAGVVVTDKISANYKRNPLVARIDKLGSSAWWGGRSSSILINRTLESYQSALSLVLQHSNSIMFIDPHYDPTVSRYQDFIKLIMGAGKRKPSPLIEIHRVCYHGSGPDRKPCNLKDLENNFRNMLAGPLQSVGLNANIFIWDDFHDRYILSDLVGILLSNGFDTTTRKNSTVSWARLGRADRDKLQRKFDPASNQHTLQAKFTI